MSDTDGMDEVLNRLNETVANWKGDPRDAEITRLRAEIEQWKQGHAAACDLAERHMEEKHRLRAEIERLRAALGNIRHKRREMDMGDLSADEAVWEVDAIARAALEDHFANGGKMIELPPAPSGWRPIETAPRPQEETRFGPLIVLASTSGHRAIGYWGERCGRWGWVNPNDHQIMDYWNAFTHWMPLPPAPGKEEA